MTLASDERTTAMVAPLYTLNPNEINKTVEEVKTPLDIHKFNNLKQFSNALQQLCQKNRKIKQSKKKKQKVDIETLHRPSSGYVQQETIFSALQKCLSTGEEKFWSKEGFDILLGNNYITAGLDDDKVFQCIWKYKAYSSFKEMAKSYIVVPEKYIIKTLKTMLLSSDENFPPPHGVAENISFIVLLPVNKVVLKDYLKLLSVNEALLLLQCLHYLLKVVSPAINMQLPLGKSIDEDVSESKVVMWLDLVMTAHLMVFTTTPTLNPLISEIKSTLKKQQMFYGDVGKLNSYLQCLKEGGKTLPEKVIGGYTIETIYM